MVSDRASVFKENLKFPKKKVFFILVTYKLILMAKLYFYTPPYSQLFLVPAVEVEQGQGQGHPDPCYPDWLVGWFKL